MIVLRLLLLAFAPLLIALLVPRAADAQQQGACAAAKAYLDEQAAAGMKLTSLTAEEARWAVKAKLDPTFLGSCTQVPEALVQRMRGETPENKGHIRMNCHLAFDYLVTEIQTGEHKLLPVSLQNSDKAWGSSYGDAADGNPKGGCPEPPELLAARATGHIVSTQLGRDALVQFHNAGETDATTEIAMLYIFGKGVEKNLSTGLGYLKLASDRGNPWAQYELSLFYMLDKIEGGSLQEGFALMKKSAEAGVPAAMRLLSTYYAKGTGTRADGKAALAWAKKAGEAGEVVATGYAGLLLYKGEVVPQDVKEATRLFEIAARAGDASSMFVLASLYAQQNNAWKKDDKIWYWYERARARGNAGAKDFLAKYSGDLREYLKKPEPVRYRPKRQYCPVKSFCVNYVHYASGTSRMSCNTGPDYWNCRDVE